MIEGGGDVARGSALHMFARQAGSAIYDCLMYFYA